MKITTYQLKHFPNGTLFSEILEDSLASSTLYKKIETLDPDDMWPEGDIMVEEFLLPTFGEVPGETCRLGYQEMEDVEWEVWEIEAVQKMVGWLMNSEQFFEAE